MFKRISLILFSILFLVSYYNLLSAQDNDFRQANRLMQQQNYEQALPILEQLHEQDPGTTIYFDRLIDCMVNLKKFERAVTMIEDRMETVRSAGQLTIRKGEILHTMGQQNEALELWKKVIGNNRNNLQYYYQIGNLLTNRREYDDALNIYKQAREVFEDTSLFINEMASAHMQAGQFSQAMHEYFKLIRENPNQMNFVQQRLLRMQDNELYEIAAMEIEDHILEMDRSHPSFNQMHQLFTWLLTETRQFRRAFIAARQYETNTDVLNYSLYSLASQFESNNEFELAAEAFRFYANLDNRSIKNQAKDRKSQVYQNWASYLGDHNLEDLNQRTQLYQKSYDLAKELLDETPEYERSERVIVRLAELSLDVFTDMDKANQWVELLKSQNENENNAYLHYLSGRLHLFDLSYSEARQALTRANRNSDDSNLAEKSRYFLSLTDFFSGDIEFAELQLRSLERRKESYYANDALKLRVWIQEGKRADTTGENLDKYAGIIESLYLGNTANAIQELIDEFEDTRNSLYVNALAEIATRSDIRQVIPLYSLIQNYNRQVNNNPLREKMLWTEASLARIILDAGGVDQLTEKFSFSDSHSDDYQLIRAYTETDRMDQTDWPVSESDLQDLYEKLILEFPSGFYAPYARDLLQKITEPTS